MQKRTEEIIAVCKGRHTLGEFAHYRDAIAAYMSDRCAFPAEEYTDGMLLGILFEAVCDYVDGADKPSCFLRQLQDSYRFHEGNVIAAICGAFATTTVRKSDKTYINGFTETSVFEVKKSENT